MATYPSLAGKVIAISGAASGMGLALAKHLYPMGCKLSLTDLNEQGLDAAVVEIASTSPPHPMSMESLPSLTYSPHSGIHSSPPPTEPQNIFSIAANVSESVEVDAWISATISRFGRLDNAANFAGIIGPFKKVSEFNDEEWQKVQDVNLRGTFYALRAQLRVLEGAGHGGSIVNTASIAGFRGGYAGAAYTMSKHGVIGLTRAASKDVGHLGIRVNVIAPGAIDTPMVRNLPDEVKVGSETLRNATPLRRPGEAEEIAKLVAWLLSDDSSFNTGAVHVIDGGLTA